MQTEMEGLEFLSQTDLLARLPPIEHSPILEKLATLGIRRFQNEYAIETPVYENGIVNHEELMRKVGSLVTRDYAWKAPFFDEHHLHWYGHRYASNLGEDPETAMKFRDLPIHKLWVPRQFHDFVHTVTIPPEIPPLEAMKVSYKQYKRNFFLHRITNEAIQLRERAERTERKVGQKGDIAYIDPILKRKSSPPEDFESRRELFIRYIEKSHRKGLIDLSILTSLEVTGVESVERMLTEIQQFTDQGLTRQSGGMSRRVDLPYEKAA